MAHYLAENAGIALDFRNWLGLAGEIGTKRFPLDTPKVSETQFSQSFADAYSVDYFGSFSAYQADTSGHLAPSSALIDHIDIYWSGVLQAQLEAPRFSASELFVLPAQDSPPLLPIDMPEASTANLPAPSLFYRVFIGDDKIAGGKLNDYLIGFGGSDMIDGGDGIDTAHYSAYRDAYKISATPGGKIQVNDQRMFIQLIGSDQGDGYDTLTNIERLEFSDMKIAFDLGGHAGTVAAILSVVFGADGLVNREYAGIGLRHLDAGTSPEDLCQIALNASGKSTASEMVTLLWQGVFSNTPSAAEAQPYVTLLETGQLKAGQLGMQAINYAMSVDAIELVGLAETGLAYV